jgi:hypothetical protein
MPRDQMLKKLAGQAELVADLDAVGGQAVQLFDSAKPSSRTASRY